MMNADKKGTAAACIVTVAVLLLMTAFTSVDSWNPETEQINAAETILIVPNAKNDVDENMTVKETVVDESAMGETLPLPAETEDTQNDMTETPAAEPAAQAEIASEDLESSQKAEPVETNMEQSEAEALVETELSETEEETEEIDYFADQFLVTVTGKTALNVREEPTTDSDWVGKMYEGCGGIVLEEGDGWTKIQSGKVVGWVSNDYILSGEAGKAKAVEEIDLVFEVESDALKVRSNPTTEEENKIRAIYGGETYLVVSTTEDGWVEIEYTEGKTGWVVGEYGTIRYSYDLAMTKEEIKAAEREKKRVSVETTTRAAKDASVDELTLLACLIQCESGSYEGQLAVANIVLNRVNSSRFPNSISEVIYASGQFSPVRSGKLAARLAKGPSSTALQAAQDALNGVNNIGDFVYFRSAKSADYDAYSAYTIVAGNCFYRK